MKESDVRDYLRATEQKADDLERRLWRLKDMQLEWALRRRGAKSGLAWHATGTVAGVALIRREIRGAREDLGELEDEIVRTREYLRELEERRREEEAERERQREEDRRRQEDERAGLERALQLERAGRREDRERLVDREERLFGVTQSLTAERNRSAVLSQDLEELRGRNGHDRGADDGLDRDDGGQEREDDDGREM